MKTLVELNASPDTANNYGCTPLLVASNSSHKFASPEIFAEAIDLLLNAGANINARTRTGRSALHLALEGGAWRGIPAAAMRVLVDRGVDVSSKDETGRTALMVGLRTRKSDRDELVAILARKSQRLTKKPRLRYKEENDEDD
jgi:ankyrin repeat protein